MTKFSTVSSRLDVELLATHQQLREAFSNSEVAEAKKKKSLLDDFNSVSDIVDKKWINILCCFVHAILLFSVAHRTDMEADAVD